MPSPAVGPWQGSTPHARIEIDYSVSRNADGTSAYYSGTVVLAADGAMGDTVNTWEVWGDAGSGSGNNVSYSWGSGGGRAGFCGIAAWGGSGGINVGGRASALEGPGATIEAVLHLDGIPLAPYTTNPAYTVRDVTSTSAVTTGINCNGNGGGLIDVSVQVSVNAQEANSSYFQAGAFADVQMSGLTRGTRYYFRVRVANNTYGWGPFGGWVAFDTLPLPPNAPVTYVNNVSAYQALINVVASTDNGGSPIDVYETYLTTNYAYPGQGGNTVSYATGGTYWATGLTRNTTYYVWSRAHNGAGWGPWSAALGFTTSQTAPGPVGPNWGFRDIGQSDAWITGLTVADNGGSAVNSYTTWVSLTPDDNNVVLSFTSAGATPEIYMTGLLPGTVYYAKVLAGNALGWGGTWSAYKGFTTLPGVSVNVNGTFKNAQPWVNVNGVWKPALRFVNVNGVWKQ